MTSRSEILDRIRANTATSGVSPVRTEPLPVRDLPGEVDLVAEFAAQLEGVSGRCHRVNSIGDAGEALRSIITGCQATRLARSDDPRVAEILAAIAGDLEIATPDSPREVLLECQVGVTTAALGIAEHGTIVMPSGEADLDRERTRLVSLLPLVHVAILPASKLVATISEALERIAGLGAGDRLIPPTVTFATGPSRTADIEQQLVVGVHGPHAQHVIVLECE